MILASPTTDAATGEEFDFRCANQPLQPEPRLQTGAWQARRTIQGREAFVRPRVVPCDAAVIAANPGTTLAAVLCRHGERWGCQVNEAAWMVPIM